MTTTPGGSRWEGRRRAREAALQMLYQTEIGKVAVADATRDHGSFGADEAIDLDDDAREYAVTLARGSWQDRQLIDDYIAAAARNWRVERLTVIDRLLLRLAVHEMLSHPTTPPRVVIDEAIELARRYSGEDAAKFVNGVLDGVFGQLKEEGKVVE
jgi:transcription antitermination protein NusB